MKTKLIFFVGMIIIVSWLLSGCATTQYKYTGLVASNSRIDAVPVVSFDMKVTKAVDKQSQDYYRSTRVGFNAVSANNRLSSIDLSSDQKHIVQLIGIPEYKRSFPNISGKRVEEWVYLNQDYLAQFIYGTLVYIGPVDDLEKVLIDLGPPTDLYYLEFAGIRKDIFKYRSRYKVYTFQDDKLIVVQ
jgi:hypothetical protein